LTQNPGLFNGSGDGGPDVNAKAVCSFFFQAVRGQWAEMHIVPCRGGNFFWLKKQTNAACESRTEAVKDADVQKKPPNPEEMTVGKKVKQ